MKVSEAIELLNGHRIPLKTEQDHDLLDAICLGIEALKQLQELHNRPYGSPLPPLPGETPEEDAV